MSCDHQKLRGQRPRLPLSVMFFQKQTNHNLYVVERSLCKYIMSEGTEKSFFLSFFFKFTMPRAFKYKNIK